MHIRNELQEEDPQLTYREIQVALWSLIETPAFNLDEVLKNGSMPSGMLRNGEPNFDVNKVQMILNRVRSEVSVFSYGPDKRFIVFARIDNSQQNGGIITCSEEITWSDGHRFSQGEGNWASYKEYSGSEKIVTLFASQTIDIGTVIFEPDNGQVKITISLNAYDELQDVSENIKIEEYSSATSGNPKVGQFC